MKKLFCLLASLFLLGSGATAVTQNPTTPRMRLLVPAYFYPAGEGLKYWDRLMEAAPRVSITAIVNPASGPGTKVDPNYVKVLERARKAGLKLLGYVSTSYGKRPLKEALADLDTWGRFYPQVKGTFFDEQASSAEQVGYYASLYDLARKKGRALAVNNPGTICAEAYLSRPATDVACLFEGFKGFETFDPPDWTKKYPAGRFSALVYKVGAAEQMTKLVHGAAQKRIGYFYVTDAAGANPWERLPSYWDQEVELIRKLP